MRRGGWGVSDAGCGVRPTRWSARRRSARAAAALAVAGFVCWCVVALRAAQSPTDVIAAANAAGWQVPDRAAQETSPVQPDAAVLKKGKSLFASRCEKCHGASGRGDGSYADASHPPADLTASTTLDGVMFYKVWNGRQNPSMPAFKSSMTKGEVWAVIEYAKSLRPASKP